MRRLAIETLQTALPSVAAMPSAVFPEIEDRDEARAIVPSRRYPIRGIISRPPVVAPIDRRRAARWIRRTPRIIAFRPVLKGFLRVIRLRNSTERRLPRDG